MVYDDIKKDFQGTRMGVGRPLTLQEKSLLMSFNDFQLSQKYAEEWQYHQWSSWPVLQPQCSSIHNFIGWFDLFYNILKKGDGLTDNIHEYNDHCQ